MKIGGFDKQYIIMGVPPVEMTPLDTFRILVCRFHKNRLHQNQLVLHLGCALVEDSHP